MMLKLGDDGIFKKVNEEEFMYVDKNELDELMAENKHLKEENEYLKLISNHRGEMVSFATSLIQDMGSEEMLKMWNDFTEVMYQKWKKKRGIK